MKFFIRNTVINGLALSLLPLIVPGVQINGGLVTLVVAGFLLTILLSIIKPLLNIIKFPLNFLTLGGYSLVINLLILYVLTVFVPTITVHAFNYPALGVGSLTLPSVHITTIITYGLGALVLLFIVWAIDWLIK